MVRKHIIFYGSVQGVGFRWRARNAAEHFSCTGWAKNEWDGSVSMEIQGEEEDIDRVILAIEKGTFVRIDNMDVKVLPVVEREYGFRTE
ncbi:MAG: acylphosphatase [Lachnospiraceae bacterium]|nr:acylphosphatase [Lachnospiraceae bacterium]